MNAHHQSRFRLDSAAKLFALVAPVHNGIISGKGDQNLLENTFKCINNFGECVQNVLLNLCTKLSCG